MQSKHIFVYTELLFLLHHPHVSSFKQYICIQHFWIPQGWFYYLIYCFFYRRWNGPDCTFQMIMDYGVKTEAIR